VTLNANTTLAEIAASESLQRELAELVLDNGTRFAMQERRISYDGADRIAEGVRAGIRSGLEWLVKEPETPISSRRISSHPPTPIG
jgi:hypothetical protein